MIRHSQEQTVRLSPTPVIFNYTQTVAAKKALHEDFSVQNWMNLLIAQANVALAANRSAKEETLERVSI